MFHHSNHKVFDRSDFHNSFHNYEHVEFSTFSQDAQFSVVPPTYFNSHHVFDLAVIIRLDKPHNSDLAVFVKLKNKI